MNKLAIVVTHPIQYYAPVFKLLTERAQMQLKVFYTWGESEQQRFDPGFGRKIEWDIPLLEGYDYTFVQNVSSRPGSSHFMGIVNPSLASQIMDWKPNAVLVYGWNYYSHLALIRKLSRKIPLWFRGDSHLLDAVPTWKAIIKSILLQWVFSHVRLAFYVGTANKNYFLRYGLRENQLKFAPHAIDNARFQDLTNHYTQEAANWRVQLGFRPDDIVLLFAGKFETKKQPLLLINAVQSINTRRETPIKLLMVGNGHLERALKHKAINDPNIAFLDFQNQSKMPIVYRLGNIFCLPSSGPGETWGLAINEALAAGIPVIASNRVGCATDLVQKGQTGLVFRVGDQENLIQTIESLSQGLKTEHNSYKATEAFIQNWSFEAQAAAFELALNQL